MVNRVLLTVFITALAMTSARAESPVRSESVLVPPGTIPHCRITETLTTRLNTQGDAFTVNVAEPVSVNGRVAIPAGAMLAGRITRMERPGRIKGVGQMRLTVEQLTFPDARAFPVSATLFAVYGANHVKVVGSEGVIKGPSSRVPDVEEIGAGTAGGTLLGLMFAQPVIGAAIGLTATTVDRMRRRGKSLTIPLGTQLNYQLTRELEITHVAPQARAAHAGQGAGE